MPVAILENSVRRVAATVCLLIMWAGFSFAQETIFHHVKIHRHRSADQRVLVDKVGALTFDDSANKLTFHSDAGDRLDIDYASVDRVVFEVTLRMRGGVAAAIVTAAPLAGPVVGNAMAGAHVHDYWFYLHYKDQDHGESVLWEVPKSASEKFIEEAEQVFGERVTVTEFPEKGATVKMEDLKALKSKQVLKVDKQNHPLPEVKADKATVVVVCPALAARFAGKGNQFKLHAKDQVVAVNKQGTYSFAYLDPGEYRLVSQAENADGFTIKVEAGREYFFLQNVFQGALKGETILSRNSRELVMFLVDGSYYSDWKPKEN